MSGEPYFGRNFCPTIDSNTDDFPALCAPITTIFGSVIYCASILSSIAFSSIIFAVMDLNPVFAFAFCVRVCASCCFVLAVGMVFVDGGRREGLDEGDVKCKLFAKSVSLVYRCRGWY